MFDWGHINFKAKLGWLNWLTHMLNSVAAAGVLAWIVERAKKCLDYGATCYIWHCMFVWWYSASWPASTAWWIANLVGFAVMVLLGEWFCVRREMQDIPLSLHKWGSRKEAAVMQPIPTEDPDQLPPKPRLRANTMLRPAAAAAANGGGSPLSAAASSAGLQLPVPGGARQPSLLQMATINSSSSARDAGAGRKKLMARPGSAVNLAAGQRPMPVADVDSP
eukprot:GHRQ01032081.1.p1 GENE.GHRQ01032081.1~~GHRQ01032081.1.p1  ORF type:complete len:221 (+),score=91.56 GHRQ01032081.1:486-1148(+)